MREKDIKSMGHAYANYFNKAYIVSSQKNAKTIKFRVLTRILKTGVPETNLEKVGVPLCKFEEIL